MNSSALADSFKRSYVASSSILAALLVFIAISDLFRHQSLSVNSVVAIAISAAPFLPFILRHGFASNLKIAVYVACIFSLAFGAILTAVFGEFVQTGGAQGPRGEGSPLAIIVAMTFFALLFFCPWLLTALRGLRSWEQTRISKAVTPDA